MLTYFPHATSMDNEAGRRSGWADPPLSEIGVAQARQLRGLIADRRFDAVFVSDLQRAVQTAELAFPEVEIRLDPRLREMNYGWLNGAPESAFDEDEARFIEYPLKQGECCRDVQRRIEEFLQECYAPDSEVAIISHRFPQLALEVIFNSHSWHAAIERDWRHVGAWQLGWVYDAGRAMNA